MSSHLEEFEVGDSVLIVGTGLDGELGTIIGVAGDPGAKRYLVVLENGQRIVLNTENLSHRQWRE